MERSAIRQRSQRIARPISLRSIRSARGAATLMKVGKAAGRNPSRSCALVDCALRANAS